MRWVEINKDGLVVSAGTIPDGIAVGFDHFTNRVLLNPPEGIQAGVHRYSNGVFYIENENTEDSLCG